MTGIRKNNKDYGKDKRYDKREKIEADENLRIKTMMRK